MDFSGDFDLVGLLAVHFKGALPAQELMQMTRRDLMWWYRIYEKQAEEENVRGEFLRKNKAIPDPREMRRLVDGRIEKRREEERKRRTNG